jgi:hypothetical protein
MQKHVQVACLAADGREYACSWGCVLFGCFAPQSLHIYSGVQHAFSSSLSVSNPLCPACALLSPKDMHPVRLC